MRLKIRGSFARFWLAWSLCLVQQSLDNQSVGSLCKKDLEFKREEIDAKGREDRFALRRGEQSQRGRSYAPALLVGGLVRGTLQSAIEFSTSEVDKAWLSLG